jgi:hypothetical protein
MGIDVRLKPTLPPSHSHDSKDLRERNCPDVHETLVTCFLMIKLTKEIIDEAINWFRGFYFNYVLRRRTRVQSFDIAKVFNIQKQHMFLLKITDTTTKRKVKAA